MVFGGGTHQSIPVTPFHPLDFLLFFSHIGRTFLYTVSASHTCACFIISHYAYMDLHNLRVTIWICLILRKNILNISFCTLHFALWIYLSSSCVNIWTCIIFGKIMVICALHIALCIFWCFILSGWFSADFYINFHYLKKDKKLLLKLQ